MPTQNATPTDAQLILQLYDLRRESEMRKARNFLFDFWPESAQDVINVFMNFGSQENAWMRQVGGYWEMAASLVVRGALNPDLFFDSNGEMFFIYAKFHPFLKELREHFQEPGIFANVEKLVQSTPEGRDRLQRILTRQAEFRARFKKQGTAAA
jgi:hypothetical protein